MTVRPPERRPWAECEAQRVSRPRPALFRALGRREPPEQITIDGRSYRLADLLKHDSWAATALYELHEEPPGDPPATLRFAVPPPRAVVCKFNRTEPILGVPMCWGGRLLARREARMLRRLADLPNVPRALGPVFAGGERLRNAAAREYVAGHPLGPLECPPWPFFRELRRTVREMHRRGIAYADLHKCENVLVGDDGRPHLIDFQISLDLPASPLLARMLRPVFRLIQRSDRYHLLKHVARRHPERLSKQRLDRLRPRAIRLHRLVGVPFRTLRRKALVLAGVRRGRGRVETEHAPEDAVRRRLAQAPESTRNDVARAA